MCGDKGELGASCFHMLSDRSRMLEREVWDKERFGQICMSAQAYANFKSAILKLCEQTKRCSWQQIKTLNSVDKKIQSFRKSIK